MNAPVRPAGADEVHVPRLMLLPVALMVGVELLWWWLPAPLPVSPVLAALLRMLLVVSVALLFNRREPFRKLLVMTGSVAMLWLLAMLFVVAPLIRDIPLTWTVIGVTAGYAAIGFAIASAWVLLLKGLLGFYADQR